jgi:hypothetical protein
MGLIRSMKQCKCIYVTKNANIDLPSSHMSHKTKTSAKVNQYMLIQIDPDRFSSRASEAIANNLSIVPTFQEDSYIRTL